MLTRDGEVPDHVIAPSEQVSNLEAFILPADNRGHILVREVVQSAGVSQWSQQTRTGLRVAAKYVAAKLLLARGQIQRRHSVYFPTRKEGSI